MVASSEEVLAPMSSWELPDVHDEPAVAGGWNAEGELLLACSSMIFIILYHILDSIFIL